MSEDGQGYGNVVESLRRMRLYARAEEWADKTDVRLATWEAAVRSAI